jgi:hypothetical protein
MADDWRVPPEYENMIESMGGIDLQLLGIGLNGPYWFQRTSDHFQNIPM